MDDSDYSYSFGEPCVGCGADAFGHCTRCKKGLCFFCAEGGIGSPALCPKCTKCTKKVVRTSAHPEGFFWRIQIPGPVQGLEDDSFLDHGDM